jgi:hypothetical protein
MNRSDNYIHEAAQAGNPPSGTVYAPNGDGSIEILDALLIAQYYVGLNPSNFLSANADVSKDGKIDIVDALRVAQYYVGLVSCSF